MQRGKCLDSASTEAAVGAERPSMEVSDEYVVSGAVKLFER